MTAREDLVRLVERSRAGQLTDDRDVRWRGTLDPESARKAAVLMLFGRLDALPAESGKPLAPADLDVLLVERADTLDNHPGQVAFPGGGVDAADGSIVAAALREAEEETGLDPLGVDVLGTLEEVDLPVSNFQVTPVVGWWASPSPVRVVDFGESARVFRVPIRDLLDPDNRYMATVRRGHQTFKSPAFVVDSVVVWGFTGNLLTRLFENVGWAVPWDTGRLIPAPL